ncbi:MAG TPA: hypothetical protein VGM88_16045 [Kofleriaceae bacterium]|jgi:hypothetical protein
MRVARALVAGGLAVASAAVGIHCSFGGGDFACNVSADCSGGECDPTRNVCAFDDNGCPSGFRYGEHSGSSSNLCTAPSPDAPPDAMIDAPWGPEAGPEVGQYCLGDVSFEQFCFDTMPTGSTTLEGTIDTTPNASGSLCRTDGLNTTRFCVITADSILVSSGMTVTVVGSRPLVLAAVSSISIDGTLDASSHGAQAGPGHLDNCTGSSAANNGGGGAGGTFGGKGGDGGNDPIHLGHGKAASVSINTNNPTTLSGGCDGLGGSYPVFGPAGAGGYAGGGVYLVTPGRIDVAGTIDASGAGGGGGSMTTGAGGGGGGSGGMVVVDGVMVQLEGSIFANGGGGGGGGGSTMAGAAGMDPTAANTNAMHGAGGTMYGGDGGDGTSGGDHDADNGHDGSNMQTTIGGGGGGGGGPGLVVFRNDTPTGGTYSPHF